MKKLPGLLLMTGDWLKDPALTFCSAETRGVWVDILCIMHEQGRTGELTGTVEQLCKAARCNSQEFERAIRELEDNKAAEVKRYGVTQENKKITLINRRMVRESKSRQFNKLRQEKWRLSQEKRENNTAITTIDMIVLSYLDQRSEDLEGGSRGEVQDAIPKVWTAVCEFYKRDPKAPVEYDASCALVDTCKRPDVLIELALISTYHSKLSAHDKKYFPKSAGRLLQKWADVLDMARNHTEIQANAPAPTYVQLRALEEEISKHPANSESAFYTGQSTPAQKAELKKMREARDGLNRQVAMGS